MSSVVGSRNLKVRAQRAVELRRWTEAELLYRQLLAMLEYLFGDMHLEIAMASHELATILEMQGKHQEAVQWRERTSETLLKLNKR